MKPGRIKTLRESTYEIDFKIPNGLAHTDTEIARAVRRKLEEDVLIAPGQIRSAVRNGWVTLEGNVPVWVDCYRVANAIHYLAGVRGITNNLVASTPEES